MAVSSAVVGIGASVGGFATSLFGSSEADAAQQRMIQLQMQMAAQQKKQMELQAKRMSLEQLRTMQKARAVALNNATNQGANSADSSGLAGGYGQIAGVGYNNLLGIAQNLQIGEKMFDLQKQYAGAQMDLASANSLTNLGQGLMSFGGSIFGASNTIGNIFGGSSKPLTSPSVGLQASGYYGTGNLY